MEGGKKKARQDNSFERPICSQKTQFNRALQSASSDKFLGQCQRSIDERDQDLRVMERRIERKVDQWIILKSRNIVHNP